MEKIRAPADAGATFRILWFKYNQFARGMVLGVSFLVYTELVQKPDEKVYISQSPGEYLFI